MSYITLTLYKLLATGQYPAAGVEKTLADWGCSAATVEKLNSAKDTLSITLPTAADGVDLFEYGDKVAVNVNRQGSVPAGLNQPDRFSGGKTLFVGYRVRNSRSASGRSESFTYKFANAWGFFMEKHVFQKLWPSWNGTALVLYPRSSVVLGQSIATITQANGVQTTQMTLAEQSAEIINFTINQTATQFGAAQFQLDAAFLDGNLDGESVTGGWQGYCPLDAANDLTCAEALKRTLKIVPQVSIWFDYTTSPPTLHIATRDTLPSATLNWGNADASDRYGNYTSKIDSREDLLPPVVDYKYKVTTSYNPPSGQPYTVETIYEDMGGPFGSVFNQSLSLTAAQVALGQVFDAEVATFDFDGGQVTTVQASIATVPFAPGSLAFWQRFFPDLNSTSSAPVALNAFVTATGAPVPASFGNILVQGQVAPWMRVGNSMSNDSVPGVSVPVTMTATFSVLDQNPAMSSGSSVPTKSNVKTKTWRGVATNLSTGTYTASESSVPDDPVPAGLAYFVWKLENMLQFDGTHGIVERDPDTGLPTVTDPVGVGVNLNLSGGLAAYATMAAQVQRGSYDLMTGRTEYSFGVATHLGGAEFIERLRINRGPRWYLLMGQNLGNATSAGSTTELGKDTAQDAPAGGPESPPWQLFPISLADLQNPTNMAVYNASTAGPPGTLLIGAPNREGVSENNWPSMVIPGTSTPDAGPGINVTDTANSAASGHYIRPSMQQLTAILAAMAAATPAGTIASNGVFFRALETCEGTGTQVTYRIFLVSDKITFSGAPSSFPPW